MSKRRVGAKPNGYWISEFSVEKPSPNKWTIAMHAGKSGHNLPLIEVYGAQKSGGSEKKMFRFPEFNSNITITRDLAASPPLTGTFDITFQNKTIRGIVSNRALKYL